MGTCIYCGQSAGLLRSKHAQCERREAARLIVVKANQEKLQASMTATVLQASEAHKLKDLLDEIKQRNALTEEEVRQALIAGWVSGVDRCLEDGVLDEEEEKRLVALKNVFNFTGSDLDKNGAHTRIVKAAVLRDLMSGILPQRYHLNEALPINLQKGEKVVWVFFNCDYLEDKTKRTYQGGSRGASIKIMKGVYYRVGAFKGSHVSTTERVLVDNGAVCITNTNIHFVGPAKSLRVPYSKVVSFLPFDDGVGIVRDAQTAKPQLFKTGDGWFTYNLVTNLAQLEKG